jgi:hypothetical protein
MLQVIRIHSAVNHNNRVCRLRTYINRAVAGALSNTQHQISTYFFQMSAVTMGASSSPLLFLLPLLTPSRVLLAYAWDACIRREDSRLHFDKFRMWSNSTLGPQFSFLGILKSVHLLLTLSSTKDAFWIICKYSLSASQQTYHLEYRDQPVSTVYGSNCCLLWEP